MKLGILLLLVSALVAGQGLFAQAPAPPPPPSGTQKQPADTPRPPAQSNPFPDDTTNVPLMPNGNTPAAPLHSAEDAAPAGAPAADVDPVRSPDDPLPDADTSAQGFSSSAAGLENVIPPPDTDIDKKGRAQPPEHQESAKEDESVGSYYLDQKDWKGALSRFESAVVLDPENPDVYWGLGEAQRHLGKLAEAKAAYEKLVEYDPDSKHGKQAKKILNSPEMANAPTASAKQP
jgi:tetratricopeptide (TPR) repeat protein